MSTYKSKTVATWLAATLGALGVHRFYLFGARHWLAWLHLPLTAFGLIGVARMRAHGIDDVPAAWHLPVLGLMIVQGMLHAIVYGLMPDERWDARHNPGQPPRATRWAPILGVIFALMVGGAVLMSTIAFGVQRFFELGAPT